MLKYVCEFRNRLVTFSSADGFVLSCNWSVRTLSLSLCVKQVLERVCSGNGNASLDSDEIFNQYTS